FYMLSKLDINEINSHYFLPPFSYCDNNTIIIDEKEIINPTFLKTNLKLYYFYLHNKGRLDLCQYFGHK
ncbi:MAG TPA: hypothetical protein VFL70_06300, partial [Bacteroidia bacterium]|nr:hypothetical protein [Bacteroidia bacterium]